MSGLIDAMESVRLQVAVWSPILRALRARCDTAVVNELVEQALAEWRSDEVLRLYGSIPGRGLERWLAGQRALAPRLAHAVEYQVLEHTTERAAFNVIRCDIATYFREIGEPTLGFGLWCSLDTTMAEVIGEGEVQLTRCGTLMPGAPVCDFHYKLLPSR